MISAMMILQSSFNSQVFQRRKNGYTNFHRSWNDYRNGFGNLLSEFCQYSIELNNILTMKILYWKNYIIELTGMVCSLIVLIMFITLCAWLCRHYQNKVMCYFVAYVYQYYVWKKYDCAFVILRPHLSCYVCFKVNSLAYC